MSGATPRRRESRVILPGETKPGLTILVPRGYETGEARPVAVCRIPTGEGETCGFTVFEHESNPHRVMELHHRRCVARNRDAIHAQSPRQRLPIFNEEEWSPEAAAYLKEVGKQMLREGRLEMRPNERIRNE